MANVESGAVILLYHGVTDAPSSGIENFSGKHIPAADFARQMDYLSRSATVLTLRELVARLQGDAPLPPRCVAVTFDDSYKNNATVALPILQHYRIPATFFIATGYVDSDRRYWTDQVEHMINLTTQSRSSLVGPNGQVEFDLSSAAARIEAVTIIKGWMKQVGPGLRNRILNDLRSATGVTDQGDSVPNYQNLSWDDVRAIASSPLYEIGGHTVNHEIMAYLDASALQNEIDGCIASLKRQTGRVIDLFSYPEGQRQHFNQQVIDALKRSGVVICPAATYGLNDLHTNPFYLNRIMVGFMGQPFPFDLERSNDEF